MTATMNGNGHGRVEDRARALAAAEQRRAAGHPVVGSQIAAELGIPARNVTRWIAQAERTTDRPSVTPADAPAATQRPLRPTQPQRSNGRNRGRAAKWAELVYRHGGLVIALAVTAIGLLQSYSHMRDLAVASGTSWPTLIPLSIDGMMAAGAWCAHRHPRYWPAWAAIVLGVAGSLAMNALASRPELVAMADVRLVLSQVGAATAALSVHLCLKR
jgi:hypothetical protein